MDKSKIWLELRVGVASAYHICSAVEFILVVAAYLC